MRKILISTGVFLIIFAAYFAVGTQFTFKPKWFTDYYNPLTKSLTQFRLDIPEPTDTYDLSFYNGKWYVPSGLLPALFLIPFQLVLDRFIPTFYLSIFFASLNAGLIYLLLYRAREDFFTKSSKWLPLFGTILYAFGTTHFYVGTLGSSWHVQQIVSIFFGNLSLLLIFKRNRNIQDYFFAILAASVALLGRPTVALLAVLPITLYIWDIYCRKRKTALNHIILIVSPLFIFTSLLMLYNYARFNHPLEYGYSYINEAPNLQARREQYGISSIRHIPHNLRHMVWQVPKISPREGWRIDFDLQGNSIFFLTPPFLAAFLAWRRNIYPILLWLTAVVTILPTLMHYSTGWMQFGYRYSLDITAILVLLSLFGIKGRINVLYTLGIFFAIYMHWFGINALM